MYLIFIFQAGLNFVGKLLLKLNFQSKKKLMYVSFVSLYPGILNSLFKLTYLRVWKILKEIIISLPHKI